MDVGDGLRGSSGDGEARTRFAATRRRRRCGRRRRSGSDGGGIDDESFGNGGGENLDYGEPTAREGERVVALRSG